jgi:RNA polymerase sigma-70 factor, ECF subfamily
MPCDHDADDLADIDRLYSYVLALTRNHAEAEDLVQVTYVRAAGALSPVRAGRNLRASLFSILRNVWLKQLKKRVPASQFIRIGDYDGGLADETAEASTDAHDICVVEIEARRVQGAIHGLPSRSREVILLREHVDFSYSEIASVLEYSEGTVMSRLARARTMLRTLFSEPPQPCE